MLPSIDPSSVTLPLEETSPIMVKSLLMLESPVEWTLRPAATGERLVAWESGNGVAMALTFKERLPSVDPVRRTPPARDFHHPLSRNSGLLHGEAPAGQQIKQPRYVFRLSATSTSWLRPPSTKNLVNSGRRVS